MKAKWLVVGLLVAGAAIGANVNIDSWVFVVDNNKLDRYRDWIDNGIEKKMVRQTNTVVAAYSPWVSVSSYTNSIQGGALLGTEVIVNSNGVDYVTARTNFPVSRVEDPEHEAPYTDAKRLKKLNWQLQERGEQYFRVQEKQYYRQTLIDQAEADAEAGGGIE